MTKEEGKGKKRKMLAGNQAGNGPFAEEEEKEENMQTGTANETGKNRPRGRPRKQSSVKESKRMKMEKIIKDKLDRAKRQAFSEMQGIKDMRRPFDEEEKKMRADFFKRVAEQGIMSLEDLKQQYDLKQLYEDFKGKFISKFEKLFQKFCVEEGIIEKFEVYLSKENGQCKEKMDEFPEVLEDPAAVSPGMNSMKLLEPTDADTKFPSLPSLDATDHRFLRPFGEGEGVDAFCGPFDSPTVMPDPFVSDQFTLSVNRRGELGFGPQVDFNASLAANSPPLQTANIGTNNADKEDNIANEAAEADNQDWATWVIRNLDILSFAQILDIIPDSSTP